MDETETTARVKLRYYRHAATDFQKFIEDYKAKIDKYPHIEARLIVSGAYHKYASRWIARMLAAVREEDIEKENLQSTTNLTEEDWETAFREHYSPFGVIQEVVLSLVMYGLQDYERLLIENGWKLPKWKRPQWLKEMEKDGQLRI